VTSAIEAARAAGCAVLATAADGEADLNDLIDSGSLGGPTVWLLGNEAHGLSDAARSGADRIVRLPVYGRAESLNLAAAAAICLYASARAHRPGLS
jgi:RNA methyltransferase, TrmH family